MPARPGDGLLALADFLLMVCMIAGAIALAVDLFGMADVGGIKNGALDGRQWLAFFYRAAVTVPAIALCALGAGAARRLRS